ncbi:MAG: 3-phosphoshikimate 1-carboxyvinyltransferase [Kiritimatiellia bacterium]
MEKVTIARASGMAGELRVPGDKSISHRVAMLSSIAKGVSTLRGFLRSEDCLNTLHAMVAMGAVVREWEDGSIQVEGTGGVLRSPDKVLDMGNSGTGMRLLTGLLAGFPVHAELTGDASLLSRPMRRIQQPLIEMGATVELLGTNGCGPIRIQGGHVHPITYELPVASAQIKSAVLLAGLSVHGSVRVIEPEETRDHTERILRALGVPLTIDGLTITLQGDPARLRALPARDWDVPGDFSSASFWLVAAAMTPGSAVVVRGVGLNPRRTALLGVLKRMGANIRITVDPGSAGWEQTGTITVKGGHLQGTRIGGREIPNLIDELPLVGVAAAVAEGVTIVADAAELRVKESDRIQAVCRNLVLMGCKAEERPDGFVVRGGRVRGGAVLQSYMDHRIVMAMSVLALHAEKPVVIEDVACVATSYPSFWQDLEMLCGAGVYEKR